MSNARHLLALAPADPDAALAVFYKGLAAFGGVGLVLLAFICLHGWM